jgi:predicted ATPase/DNA-binding winged helix-turn-helix (wHTH) protein
MNDAERSASGIRPTRADLPADMVAPPAPRLSFGPFNLRAEGTALYRGEERVRLGSRALKILATLMARAGQVVSRADLVAEVWPDTTVAENNLTVQMTALRQALGDGQDGAQYIVSMSGRGYRFVAPILQSSGRNDGPEAIAVGPPFADTPGDALKTNLPLPMHRIIARETELAELEDGLRQHRLVTVVGSGGVGKTRLAVELGRRVLPRYADGVWLVDLAPLSDPDLIASATAAVLDLPAEEAAAETLARRIGRRELLLIFDNCEHLVDAVADLVQVLVSRAGALTVLATSQESLRVGEEQIYALEPLSLAPVGAAEIADYGAVSLFVERARLADRHFALTSENTQGVAEVCRRLGGVPLALEMAAARMPLLGIDGLLSGLAERLSLLKGAPRRSDGRYRSLRDLAAWSYGLLDEIDRKVFRRLAIFPGSFTQDAAVAIVASLGIDHWGALDALWRLREKSLIVVEHGAPLRYRLLETLRLYAIEQLQAGGESDAVAEQHARHFADVLLRAEAEWEITPDPDWLALYRPDLDDLRAALDWALAEPGRRRLALRLGQNLRLLAVLSLITEGRRYADRLVAAIDDETPPAIAAGLIHQGARFWLNSFDARWPQHSERAVALYREIGDRLGLVRSLTQLANFRVWQGRHEEAEALLIEAWDLVAPTKFGKAKISTKICLGILSTRTGEFSEAREYYLQTIQLARDLRSQSESLCLLNLAVLEFSLGDVEHAIERGREAVACARATPGRRFLGPALENLAAYLLARGSPEEARRVAEEAFSHLGKNDSPTVLSLQVWAVLAAFEGRLTQAAQLIGFVDAERVRKGQPRQPSEQRLYDELMRRLEAGLPLDDLQARKAEGAFWSEAKAIDFTFIRLVSAAHSVTTSSTARDEFPRAGSSPARTP